MGVEVIWPQLGIYEWYDLFPVSRTQWGLGVPVVPMVGSVWLRQVSVHLSFQRFRVWWEENIGVDVGPNQVRAWVFPSICLGGFVANITPCSLNILLPITLGRHRQTTWCVKQILVQWCRTTEEFILIQFNSMCPLWLLDLLDFWMWIVSTMSVMSACGPLQIGTHGGNVAMLCCWSCRCWVDPWWKQPQPDAEERYRGEQKVVRIVVCSLSTVSVVIFFVVVSHVHWR